MHYSSVLFVAHDRQDTSLFPHAPEGHSRVPSEAKLLAIPWSQQSYQFYSERPKYKCQDHWNCVWLFMKSATTHILDEIAQLNLPLALIADQDPEQIRRATAYMNQYPNICGIALTPLNEDECECIMEKMRNRVMSNRLWDALESTLFPDSTPKACEVLVTKPESVLYAQARNQYTQIYSTAAEKHLKPQTLGALVQQLEAQTPFGKIAPLVRVHDRYAVNPAHVRTVRPSESKRDYMLTLSNGQEIKMSRTYKHNLAKLPVKVQRSRTQGSRGGGGVKNLMGIANKFSYNLFSDGLLNFSDGVLNSA